MKRKGETQLSYNKQSVLLIESTVGQLKDSPSERMSGLNFRIIATVPELLFLPILSLCFLLSSPHPRPFYALPQLKPWP